MAYSILQISLHLVCFAFSFYALSGIQFEKICDVRKPAKVQLLLVFLSFGLGYLAAQFILAITIYNGL